MQPLSRYDRAEKLLGGLDIASSRGIEIGALDSPMIRPPESNVRYVDHADQAQLRVKYANDASVSADRIVPVDAVWGDRKLAECFAGERFDYVIASHVIEHVPDVVGWLQEIAEVLKPDGRLILAIPDRRYSFDLVRRETTLSELIDNYLRGVRCPTPGQVFDFTANAVDFDHMAAWFPSSPAQPPQRYTDRAWAMIQATKAQAGQYMDAHCSVFTARSLLNLLEGLMELELLPFRVDRFHVAPVGSGEMSLVLLREPEGADEAASRRAIHQLLHDGVDSEGLPLDAQPLEAATALPVQERDHGRVAELTDALAALHSSSSWRLTQPLRNTATAMREIRGWLATWLDRPV